MQVTRADIFSSGGQSGSGLWSGWGLSKLQMGDRQSATVAAMALRRASLDEEWTAEIQARRAERLRLDALHLVPFDQDEDEHLYLYSVELEVLDCLRASPPTFRQQFSLQDSLARIELIESTIQRNVSIKASEVAFRQDENERYERKDYNQWHLALIEYGHVSVFFQSFSLQH